MITEEPHFILFTNTSVGTIDDSKQFDVENVC